MTGNDVPAGAILGPTVGVLPAEGAGAEEHARIVAAYGGIYHDDKLEQTLARIVGRVVAASDRPDQPYRITILNAPAINAFALPGGYLYVTRGLLALANDFVRGRRGARPRDGARHRQPRDRARRTRRGTRSSSAAS